MGIRFTVCTTLLALFSIPVATSRADILYVSNFNDGTIAKITSDGAASVFADLGTGGKPRGVAFDAAGNLYAAHGNDIVKFDANGVASTFATGTDLSQFYSIAFDGAGNLYAANGSAQPAEGYSIQKFTPDGTPSIFATAGLSFPVGLAFDRLGNLFVANQGNSTIVKFDSAGFPSLFSNSSKGVSSPRGLAFDSAGILYAAQFGGIEKYTSAGVGSKFANSTSSLGGLAFDSVGYLYVLLPDNDIISKLSPSGMGSFFTGDGLSGPTFAAFTDDAGHPLPLPAPEPSSLGLLAIASVGFIKRTKRSGGRAVAAPQRDAL